MVRLRNANPLWHALAWIAIYVVVVNVGDAASDWVGVQHVGAAVGLVILAAVLIVHVRANGWIGYYRLGRTVPRIGTVAVMCLPLGLLVLLQLARGLDHSIGVTEVGLIIVLMTCVGFIEELLFRGFLFWAILEAKGLNRAVVISGLTFGIGHVLNLARGYSATDQIYQILLATAIGVVLALLVVFTGSIIPGIIFHAAFNIAGSLVADDAGSEANLAVAMIVICVVYGLWLHRTLHANQPVTGRF